MAKKQEDNRDIFDKVADIVVPAAGAYVGARAGRSLTSRAARKAEMEHAKALRKYNWRDRSGGSALAEKQQKLERSTRNMEYSTIAGGVVGGTAGLVANGIYNKSGKRRK